MHQTFFELSDFSSFIEASTGLLFAFAGISQIHKYILNSFTTKINAYCARYDSLRVSTPNFELLIPDIKKKRLRNWILWATKYKDLLHTYYRRRFNQSLTRSIAICSTLALFGSTILFITGLTRATGLFPISFNLVYTSNLAYKILFIYSIITSAYVAFLLTVKFKAIEIFKRGPLIVFSINFIITLFFFIFSLSTAILLPAGYNPQNIAIGLSLFLIFSAYPIFIIVLFVRFSIILQTFHSQTLFLIDEWTATRKSVIKFSNKPLREGIAVVLEENGKYNLKESFSKLIGLSVDLVRHNLILNINNFFHRIIAFFRRIRRPNQFYTLLNAGKYFWVIIILALILLIASVKITITRLHLFEEEITKIIENANNSQRIAFQDCFSSNSNISIKNLERYYVKNSPALNEIKAVINRRKGDVNKLYLNRFLSYYKFEMNGSPKIAYSIISDDSVFVKTKEYWMLVWENPSKTNMRIKFESNKNTSQEYILINNNGWKISSNKFYGTVDTTYSKLKK